MLVFNLELFKGGVMSKNDTSLKLKLLPFIDALESRLSTRASIINNAELLINLRDEGFKVDDILEITGCTYSRQSFSTILHEAKKKGFEKNSVLKNESKITAQQVNDIQESKFKQSVEEWNLKTNINISERQILRLEKNGIDTEKLNELGLNTTSQISKYLTQIEHKKTKEL